MGELGFLGAPIPERYGGAGMDYISFALLCEELERADTAFRVVQSVHVGLNSLTLLQWGTEDAAAALARAPGEGREAGHVRAHRAGRGHRRRQPRRPPPAATATSTCSTATRSGSASPTSPTTSSCSPRVDRAKKHKGITAFVLERGHARPHHRHPPRQARHPRRQHRARSTWRTCASRREHRIGEEGEGFLIAMSAIDQGRYTVAAGAVGLAQACLDASVRYAHERETFGEEIGRHQLVKQMIANMAKGTEIGRLLVFQAGALKNRGLRNTRETSLAKWHATDHSVQAALDAIQIHGANGYSQRVPGRALPAQLEGRRHLRGHQPAPHADPGRLRPGLPRGPAAALRAVARPGLRARLAAAPRCRAPSHRRPRSARRRPCPRLVGRELDTLTAVADTFVAGTAPRRARLAADALNLAADPDQVLQLRLVLRAFDSRLANLLLTGRRCASGALDLAGRERYLLGWATLAHPAAAGGVPGPQAAARVPRLRGSGRGRREPAPGRDRLRAPARAGDRRPVADRAARRPRSRGARHPATTRSSSRRTRSSSGSGAGGGVVAADLARGGRSVVVLEAGPFVPEPEMPVDELAAFDRLYLNHGAQRLVGRVDHDVRRRGRRGRHARQLDDVHRPARARPSAVGDASRASTGFDDGRWSTRTSSAIERELGVREPPNVPPKDSSILRGAAALGEEVGRDAAQRHRLRRLRPVRVRLPAGRQAVGDPGAPRRGVAARGADRPRRAGGAGAGRGRARRGRRGAARSSTASGAGSWSGRRTVVVAAGTLRTPVVLLRSGIDHPAMGRHLRLHPVVDPRRVPRRGRDDVARDDAGRAVARAPRRPGPTRDGGGFIVESAPGTPGLIGLVFPWDGRAAFRTADAARSATWRRCSRSRADRGGGPGPDLARRPAAHRLHGGARGSRRAPAWGSRPRPGSPGRAARGGWSRSGRRRRGSPRQGGPGDAGGVRGVRRRGSATSTSGPTGARSRRRTRWDRRGPARPAATTRATRGAASGRPTRDRAATRSIGGLYVGDASLFPTALGVNPMITTMVWARRVARTVLVGDARG